MGDNKDNKGDEDILNMLKNLKKNKDNIENNILNNGILGKLATELTEEIDINKMNINIENTNNVEDIFSNLMKGEGPLNFMNLIQTVGQKIKNKVDNGELNESDLFSEATKMMGNFNQNTQPKPQQPSQQNTRMTKPLNKTQERLRKKLEEKKKNK